MNKPTGIRWEYRTDPHEGRGAIAWCVAAIVLALIFASLVCGCVNLQPRISNNAAAVEFNSHQTLFSWSSVLYLGLGAGAYKIWQDMKDKGK
jgi:hypothetical protein